MPDNAANSFFLTRIMNARRENYVRGDSVFCRMHFEPGMTDLGEQETVQRVADVSDAVPPAVVFVPSAVHPYCCMQDKRGVDTSTKARAAHGWISCN